MTIAPIVKTVTVKTSPERAFEAFVGGMAHWWPKDHTVGKAPFAEIVVERRPGGRWFERSVDGVECDWGKVLEYAPPGRLLLAWQLDASFSYDANSATDVELTFKAEPGGTLVTLEHRDLERFGDSAEKVAAQLGGGWPTVLSHYQAFADGGADNTMVQSKEKTA